MRDDSQMRWWIEQLESMPEILRQKVYKGLMKELWSRWMKTLSTQEIKFLINQIKV
jgi:Fe-S cluster biosynthesis and repair protein YggX